MKSLIAVLAVIALVAGSLCAGKPDRLERRALRKEARAASLHVSAAAYGSYGGSYESYSVESYGSAGGYATQASSIGYGSDGGMVETYSQTRTYRAPVLVKVCRNGVCRYEYR
jgi:hypothetical protein